MNSASSLRPASAIALWALVLTSSMIPGRASAQACGAEGQRPCNFWERVPACTENLVESGGSCVHPACGRAAERACTVGERIPSCDTDLVEYAGACWVFGACGTENGRACTLAERFPSCAVDLVEQSGTCVHPACGRLGERPCGVTERLPSCDSGLLEYSGTCVTPGACGGEGGRPCGISERTPSCDSGLVERSGVCVRLPCGALGQRACGLTERLPSCDVGLIELEGTCFTFGACGGERERRCTVGEQFPSCDPGLYEDAGRCRHPQDTFLRGACSIRVNGAPLPGDLTATLVSAQYQSPFPRIVGLWGLAHLSPNALTPNMGVLDAECRAADDRLVSSALDTSGCLDAPFVDQSGVLRCSTGTRPNDLAWVGSPNGCTRYWMEGATLHADCPQGAEEILDVNACLGGVGVDTRLGLTCHTQPLPTGSYLQSCRDILRVGRNSLAAECLGPNGYQPTMLTRVDQCTQGVSNHFGHLICGVPAMVTVPLLIGSSLKEARDLVQSNGLLVGRVDSSWTFGTDDTLFVVAQVPAAGDVVAEGSPVSLVAVLVTDGATQACDGRLPEHFVYCVTCPSNLLPDTRTEVEGTACTRDQLEQGLGTFFGNCRWSEEACGR